jgi:hypothetical protein
VLSHEDVSEDRYYVTYCMVFCYTITTLHSGCFVNVDLIIKKWIALNGHKSIYGCEATEELCKVLDVLPPSVSTPCVFELCYSGVINTIQRKAKRPKTFVLCLEDLLCVLDTTNSITNRTILYTQVSDLVTSGRYLGAPSANEWRRKKNLVPVKKHAIAASICKPSKKQRHDENDPNFVEVDAITRSII